MAIASTVAQYLIDHGVTFDVVVHPSTMTAAASAEGSHISANRIAKAVVLKGGDGFMVAVLPASRRIQFEQLRRLLERDMDMANEEEIETLFADCDPGAVPALGGAYGLKTIVDDSLALEPEIYLEGGDHESLVRIAGTSFRDLMAGERQGHFTGHAEAGAA